MATPKRPHTASIYQIKVTLKGSRPPICCRLQLRGETRLSELHAILQIAMGWADAHLHQFKAGEQSFGKPDPDDWAEVRDERKVRLSQVAPAEKARLVYEYDFGDSWEHEIVVEKILPPAQFDCDEVWTCEELLSVFTITTGRTPHEFQTYINQQDTVRRRFSTSRAGWRSYPYLPSPAP